MPRAIEVIFDPKVMSYRKLLEFFFQIHDPTTLNRQGNDRGLSYRSAIFYTSEEQKETAEDTIADVDASDLWPGKVVTEVAPAGAFWEAEPEHQDYLERIPNGYTCHFVRPEWKLPGPRGQEGGRRSLSRAGMDGPGRLLTAVQSKCQQYVARLAGDATVAGIDIHHALGDGCAAVVQRAAHPGNPVHRVEGLGRVEIPDHPSIGARVGA